MKDRFALELDHMAECVRSSRRPHTPGEEGLQDLRIIAALYQAAQSGRTVMLQPQPKADSLRGPPPG